LNFLLIHAPLVGPAVWKPMMDHLTSSARRGARVAVTCPDLTSAVMRETPDRMQRFVADAAAAATGGDIVLVGFSGAGVLLPNIAAELAERVAVTVFVDAVVPPARGHHRLDARFTEFVDSQTVDGVLALWLDWWPDEIARMLPEASLRDQIAADMPRVPREFYNETLDVPVGWVESDCRYLQLSPAYDADRVRAQTYGWPTATVDGTHLSIVTDPVGVSAAISRLAR